MSEMLERVEKAMFERRPAYTSSSGAKRWTWDMADSESKAYWLDLAGAAIEALREPTEAMAIAARNSGAPDREPGEYPSFEDMWRAAIAAAHARMSRTATAGRRDISGAGPQAWGPGAPAIARAR